MQPALAKQPSNIRECLSRDIIEKAKDNGASDEEFTTVVRKLQAQNYNATEAHPGQDYAATTFAALHGPATHLKGQGRQQRGRPMHKSSASKGIVGHGVGGDHGIDDTGSGKGIAGQGTSHSQVRGGGHAQRRHRSATRSGQRNHDENSAEHYYMVGLDFIGESNFGNLPTLLETMRS